MFVKMAAIDVIIVKTNDRIRMLPKMGGRKTQGKIMKSMASRNLISSSHEATMA
jgi:hypothetical protein